MSNKLPSCISVEHLAGYARRMSLPKSMLATTHKHNVGHWTVLETGSVLLVTEERRYLDVYHAPAAFWIPAGIAHKIEALTDNVSCLCLHTFPIGSEEADALGVTMDSVLIKE